jgi:lipopolysaccharide/colanic/teichoic acid biosynthesis glycosyltransferase
MPLLHVDHPTFDGAGRFMKSLFDRGVAFLALALAALPMLVIALIIRVTTPGPALFRQVRVGRDGREFRIFKFRTMTNGADRLALFQPLGDEVDAILLKERNDPRITRVGAVLRRYSLDDLPQLLNVVRGEMSLVGPRPLVLQEVASYGPELRKRLLFRPGMTGLWQVSGRSDVSWDERMRLDLRYVENWSLALDLQILWKTCGAVVRADGAY